MWWSCSDCSCNMQSQKGPMKLVTADSVMNDLWTVNSQSRGMKFMYTGVVCFNPRWKASLSIVLFTLRWILNCTSITTSITTSIISINLMLMIPILHVLTWEEVSVTLIKFLIFFKISSPLITFYLPCLCFFCKFMHICFITKLFLYARIFQFTAFEAITEVFGRRYPVSSTPKWKPGHLRF